MVVATHEMGFAGGWPTGSASSTAAGYTLKIFTISGLSARVCGAIAW
jgi:hypothetical protein